DARLDIGLHGGVCDVRIAHDVDGVDHAIAHGPHGALAVPGREPLPDLRYLVGEPGPFEVAGVAVHHGVRVQVAPSELDALVALAHAYGHVAVDGARARSGRRTCRTALAHLLDRPGNVRGRQVVEQHPV